MNRKVLISCMSLHIGDFIWATSAIAILKTTFPNIKITVIACKPLQELIENNPIIDKAIYTIYPQNSLKIKIKRLLTLIKIIPQIFFQNYDDCIIFAHSKISVLIAKICRIKNIVGTDYLWTGNNIIDPLSKYYTKVIHIHPNQDNIHACIKFQTVIKSYFGIFNNSKPVIPTCNNFEISNFTFFKNDNSIKVALCIYGSKMSNNIWDIQNFKDVVIMLSDKFKNITFYLVGSKANFDHSQKLISILDKDIKIYNICGKTSLLELVYLFKYMNILFSVDTGVTHLAATTNIKIFSIYGPTLPQQTAPISDKVITFYEGEKCSPCMHQTLVLNKPCQYYPKPICLLKIKPETVVKKITEFLSNSK